MRGVKKDVLIKNLIIGMLFGVTLIIPLFGENVVAADPVCYWSTTFASPDSVCAGRSSPDPDGSCSEGARTSNCNGDIYQDWQCFCYMPAAF